MIVWYVGDTLFRLGCNYTVLQGNRRMTLLSDSSLVQILISLVLFKLFTYFELAL
jgi:hypothetical protein